MKKLWDDLVVENPMLIEITRFRRRYFSFSAANPVNGVILGLVCVCYATLLLIVVENRTSISPIVLIMIETGMLCLFAPMMLYGSVAGERERRSWDLLLAAPITKSQIVMGKFVGALAALAIAVLAFQIPVLITAFSYEGVRLAPVLDANLVSFTFLACVCALTILFSARVKRGLMALGATLGILMTFLIVIPAFLGFGSASVVDRRMGDFTFFFHPFYVLQRISDMQQQTWYNGYGSLDYESNLPPFWWGIPQILVYVAGTAILIVWAINTLNFAENEVKFLPQGNKDA